MNNSATELYTQNGEPGKFHVMHHHNKNQEENGEGRRESLYVIIPGLRVAERVISVEMKAQPQRCEAKGWKQTRLLLKGLVTLKYFGKDPGHPESIILFQI